MTTYDVQPLTTAPGTILGVGYFASAPGWHDTGSSISGIGYGAKIVADADRLRHAVIVWDRDHAWLLGDGLSWSYCDADRCAEQATDQIRRDQARREAEACRVRP